MKFLGRLFLLIALVFLGLDIYQPIAGPGTADAPAAINEPVTSSDTAATDGAASDDGAAESGAEAPAGDKAPVPDPVAETSTSLAPNGRVVLHQLSERWFDIHPESALQVSPAISRHVSPWLDDNIVQPLMLQPAFLIFFVLSLIFSFFSWLLGRMRNDDW